MDSFNYTTIEGDRIDVLAHRYYGSNAGIKIISDANPNVPLNAVFPIGTTLIIPIVEDSNITKPEDLPPWKR